MPITDHSKLPKPHKVSVVFGLNAILAYQNGETRRPVLRKLGEVRDFAFATIPELNAFIAGIEAGEGYPDTLPVDDLEGGAQ